MEVYVDDMLVKNSERLQYISKLKQCFTSFDNTTFDSIHPNTLLRSPQASFLGFMVTH